LPDFVLNCATIFSSVIAIGAARPLLMIDVGVRD